MRAPQERAKIFGNSDYFLPQKSCDVIIFKFQGGGGHGTPLPCAGYALEHRLFDQSYVVEVSFILRRFLIGCAAVRERRHAVVGDIHQRGSLDVMLRRITSEACFLRRRNPLWRRSSQLQNSLKMNDECLKAEALTISSG